MLGLEEETGEGRLGSPVAEDQRSGRSFYAMLGGTDFIQGHGKTF